MRRAGKDSASPIIHQNKVCHPYWQFPIWIKRMAHSYASIDAFFISLFHIGFRGTHLAAFFIKCCNITVFSLKMACQWMICGNAYKRSSHKGIWARRINIYRTKTVWRCYGIKAEFKTTGFPNPICLHQFYFGRPIIQSINGVKQIARKI